MADIEEPTEQKRHDLRSKVHQTELQYDNQQVRYSVPVELDSSLSSAKRFGVVDFDKLGDDVLDEFDPLKECVNNPQSEGNSASLLNVKDDRSLARHSAPGLLFGNQSDEEISNDIGATGFSHFGSEDDILVGSGQFEHNGIDDDLQKTAKKGEKSKPFTKSKFY